MPPKIKTMSIFDRAINDIFKCADFLESCVIGDTVYDCICSALEEGAIYSEAGLVEDENFTLDIKLPVVKIPKKGDAVIFRDEKYKVSLVTTDSANASIKVHLRSTSQG